MIRLFLSLGLLLIAGTLPANAGPGPTPPTPPVTPPTVPGPGGACDYSAIIESLYGTESASAGGYTAICRDSSGNVCESEARGKYQFIPATRSAYINQHPECNGQACNSQEAWITEPCWPVQECIMNAYLADSQAMVRNSPACQELLNSGRTFTTPRGTCQPTESGLVGAMHLGGNGSDSVCRRIQNGGGSSDELGTSVAAYMCQHGGLPMPGACDISTLPPGTVLPPATQGQLDSPAWPDWNTSGGDPQGLLFNIVRSFMAMAEQFTINMIQQMQMLGMLLDAKHQQETQQLFQEKMAEAHKDYQPSEQMCTFGTFTRELLATERSSNVTREALSRELMQRETGSAEAKASTIVSDSLTRIAAFREYFCNRDDNVNGLGLLCPDQTPPETRGRDIDYTTTLETPFTLNIDLRDDIISNDERNVFALIDNLFSHDTMPSLPIGAMDQPQYQYHYLNMRSIFAIRGIARNSIANVIALKTASPIVDGQSTNAPYLRALFREMGVSDAEIEILLGTNPSYHAQMEVLTKKIYQSPVFYTNLYDKPANVKRIRAAMTAIKLMQDRDIAAAMQRREMLLSLMLELRLRQQAEAVYSATEESLFDEQ